MKEIRVKKDTLLPQLKKARLFRHLPDEAIEKLIECSRFVEYDPQEILIREHAVEQDVYVILSGACSVMVHQEGGDAYVATLGAGQVVGEAAIFSNMPRIATVLAQDTVRLMCFERTAFLKVLQDDPRSGMKVLFMIVHNLMMKLREVNLELAFERRDDGGQAEVDQLIESLIPAAGAVGLTPQQ
ncbi:Cyclic nucleotide-binding domain-containing protein [Alkalispirochaeta americana]|uniref:Cyclic nucleotide-binding domain-containing protein n=1 Tax=Alkalispirochaeta americana TaxID=159291 RepID=A0A1N6VTI7_9SPIO|nr:cyclic nucleotide-binding domain-containing protein [Alkalispirochaeta americana]SIQ81181.1 Cyclic nucleotide-binding domain-containing protein [Alkalispirochaeta americana]